MSAGMREGLARRYVCEASSSGDADSGLGMFERARLGGEARTLLLLEPEDEVKEPKVCFALRLGGDCRPEGMGLWAACGLSVWWGWVRRLGGLARTLVERLEDFRVEAALRRLFGRRAGEARRPGVREQESSSAEESSLPGVGAGWVGRLGGAHSWVRCGTLLRSLVRWVLWFLL